MKKIIVLMLGISISFSISAQLLWKISGNKLKHPSYLFVSQKFVTMSYLDSVASVYKAFNETEIVITEVQANSIDSKNTIMKAALLPKQQNIKKYISESQLNRLDEELKSVLKLGIKEVGGMQPVFVNSMYFNELFKKTNRIKDEAMAESYFQLVAEEQGRRVIGLDNIEQHLQLMYKNGSVESQTKAFVNAILHKDSVLHEMNINNKYYKTGKIDELANRFFKSELSQPGISIQDYAQRFKERSVRWVTQLSDLMMEKSSFCVFDVNYVGGESGILKELEKKGFKVEAVQ